MSHIITDVTSNYHLSLPKVRISPGSSVHGSVQYRPNPN